MTFSGTLHQELVGVDGCGRVGQVWGRSGGRVFAMAAVTAPAWALGHICQHSNTRVSQGSWWNIWLPGDPVQFWRLSQLGGGGAGFCWAEVRVLLSRARTAAIAEDCSAQAGQAGAGVVGGGVGSGGVLELGSKREPEEALSLGTQDHSWAMARRDAEVQEAQGHLSVFHLASVCCLLSAAPQLRAHGGHVGTWACVPGGREREHLAEQHGPGRGSERGGHARPLQPSSLHEETHIWPQRAELRPPLCL